MRHITVYLPLFLLLFAFESMACVDGQNGFMPENDLYIGVNDKSANDMTKEKFNAIIDKVDQHYNSIVKSKGGNLRWNRKWDDGTVNASAQRMFSSWVVNMYGGLARHELVTDDAFALVVCHELGHHLGGAPKVKNIMMTWASNEGQSDYFGSMKCFRRVFESDDNEAIVAAMEVDATVTQKCSESFTQRNDVALCVRTAMAGLSLAKLLGSLRGTTDVKFDTPDPSVVSQTNDAHPAAQCRLDTYFQGALCDKSIDDDVSNRDAAEGVCTSARGYSNGVRPLCWYKP